MACENSFQIARNGYSLRRNFVVTMKNLVFIILFFTSAPFFGQKPKDPVKISTLWKVDETKKIHVDHNTKVSFDDSLVKHTQYSYDVVMRLIDNSETYTLNWVCLNNPEMLQFANPVKGTDVKENQILQILKTAEEKIVLVDLRLEMNKTTGEIIEWANGRELLKNTEFKEKKELKTWCFEQGFTEAERVDLELEFSKKLNAAYGYWRQTLLQNANMFFESYKQSFVVNQTITSDVQTLDVLSMQDGETQFPGKQTCDATEVNDRLIMDKKVEYDAEFLSNYLRKKGGKFESITSSEVKVYEEEQAIFNLSSSWLINYKKKLHFQVKGMKTTSTTTVTFIAI